ncbi:MAG: 2-hydroxyisocaproyl-CoA dehydratase activator [Firmicutes bacterium]|nr:2-hydroxyisocaproyl-CoA dehydratase activator [candidate division NPL-UPA2 bacterium]
MQKHHAIGICLGASNIKVVVGKSDAGVFSPLQEIVAPHSGNARSVLQELLTGIVTPESRLAVTGHKLKDHVRLPSISELEATELALAYLRHSFPAVDAIVSAGGENVIAYELDKERKVIAVHTGNKCASGTGEFFLQQIRRMNLNPAEAQALAAAGQDAPYKISARCSVFSKSDCTHALNKGTPKERVVAGLCHMVATKIAELLKSAGAKHVLLAGGTAKNQAVIDHLTRDGFVVSTVGFGETLEALGAALWAVDNGGKVEQDGLFVAGASAFEFLAPLADYGDQVIFKDQAWGQANENDICILGLDAGSTTTKAVIMRVQDHAIVAGAYLRTNGDPIAASRECYRSLESQVPAGVKIIGLGVTGSGRQIVGLHAQTTGIVNEIIAHNTAAVYFDPEVDTIFEIGGQDAKYTYTAGGVPVDYAMNEACSAGTGSFLEEAARESLSIATEEIAAYALKGQRPPNFNDQCAAFIGSDVKTSIQEGISNDDIAAGLVYAICLNYLNRVKGSRKVGNKIFMQGGVCYNRAVPLAMAALTKRKIVVPPDPGLMGAFGVALEVQSKIRNELLALGDFSLEQLAERNVAYGRPFVCQGGAIRCDRKCKIALISIDGQAYPFGGACNKYYNERVKQHPDVAALDLVATREELLYNRPLCPEKPNSKTVGVSTALMTANLYPLYHAFLTRLGFSIVLGDELDAAGIERRRAPFCYPVDMAHGLFMNLVSKAPDYILLPHVRATPVVKGALPSTTCPLIQGEPYVLRRTFLAELKGIHLLTPVLNMPHSYSEAEDAFLEVGKALGATELAAREAFLAAVRAQDQFLAELRRMGRAALERAATLQRPTVVLFGRAYNALAAMANMGIPGKFASRGILTLPFDCLDTDSEPAVASMHWAAGQSILKAAQKIKDMPNIFGCFITNFSCGPDSFVLSFFRDEMGDKPSLTLELDSHTADAGIDTRIEAFLDIAQRHMQKAKRGETAATQPVFRPAETLLGRQRRRYRTSQGEEVPLDDGRVRLLIPSMGEFVVRLMAATFRYAGINAIPLPPPSDVDLQRGKEYSTCKECLPLMLTMGSLYNYLDKRDEKELTIYFMPSTGGSCRFAQYSVLTRNLIHKQRIENLAVMSLTSQNSYGGLGIGFTLRGLWAATISDVYDEIRAAAITLAKDKAVAQAVLAQAEALLEEAIATATWTGIKKALVASVALLKSIPLHTSLAAAPKVAIIGEIYVRRDGFSQRYLVEQLAEKGVVALMAPIAEWVYYTNYLAKHGLRGKTNLLKRISCSGKAWAMEHYEKAIKDILVESGLYDYHLLDISHLIESVSDLINPELTGEAILTLSCALNDIIDRVDGVVSIGPFGCMPARIAEAMIKQTIDVEKPRITSDQDLTREIMAKHPHLPFISIESDGSPFPPVVAASLESFVLQSKRVHRTRHQRHTRA